MGVYKIWRLMCAVLFLGLVFSAQAQQPDSHGVQPVGHLYFENGLRLGATNTILLAGSLRWGALSNRLEFYNTATGAWEVLTSSEDSRPQRAWHSWRMADQYRASHSRGGDKMVELGFDAAFPHTLLYVDGRLYFDVRGWNTDTSRWVTASADTLEVISSVEFSHEADGVDGFADAKYHGGTHSIYMLSYATNTTVLKHDLKTDVVSVVVDGDTNFLQGIASTLSVTEDKLFVFSRQYIDENSRLAVYDLEGGDAVYVSFAGLSTPASVYDGRYVFSAGHNTIMRTDPDDLSTTLHHMDITGSAIADDMAELGDWIYVGTEVEGGRDLYRIRKDFSEQEHLLRAMKRIWAVHTDGTHIYAVGGSETADGSGTDELIRIDPLSLYYERIETPSTGRFNEIALDLAGNAYMTTYEADMKLVRMSVVSGKVKEAGYLRSITVPDGTETNHVASVGQTIASIEMVTLDSNKTWTASTHGDFAVVHVQGNHTLTIGDPVNTNTPIVVGAEIIQQGTNAWQAVLGNVKTPGGIAYSQGTETDGRDYIELRWTGADWWLTGKEENYQTP